MEVNGPGRKASFNLDTGSLSHDLRAGVGMADKAAGCLKGDLRGY